MTDHNVSEFWVIKINLVNKVDSTDTMHFYVCNRHVQNILSSVSQPLYPILESARLTQKQAGFTPSDSQGRITLSNARNSMGTNRRASDFFEKYTPMFQDIQVYWCEVTSGDVDINGDLTLVWTDTVEAYRFNATNDSISLQLKSNPIAEQTASYEITNQLWSGAPDKAFGKHLPVVFGENVEVETIDVGAANAYDRYFVYATTWADDFVNGGVQSYWMKDIQGEYQEVDSYSATTDVYGLAQHGSVTGYFLMPSTIEVAFLTWGAPGASSHGVIYGGQIELRGNTVSGSWGGEIILKLYQDDGRNNWHEEVIGEARIDKSTISSSLSAGTGFFQGFEFDNPIVIKNNSGRLWFSIRNSSTSATSGGSVDYGTSGISTSSYTWFDYSLPVPIYSNGRWEFVTDTAYAQCQYALYCLNFTDTPSPGSSVIDDKTGKGSSFIVVSQSTASSGQGLENLDVKLKINGLEDNSAGDITGTSYQILDGGVEAAELLTAYGWNGSNWVGSTIFDDTFKSSTHSNHNLSGGDTYPRELGGSSRGRVTVKQLLAEIARNSAMFITRLPGTYSVGAYLWGDTLTESATITDDQMQLQEYFATSRSTIVNDIKLNYDRRLINVQFAEQVINDPNIREHVANFSLNYVDNPTLLGESKDLYGIRDLANNLFNFINDATSAESVANFIARTQDGPAEFSRVVVPYSDFSSLEPFDVVTLKSTLLPHEYGTSPNIAPMVFEDPMRSFYFDSGLDVYIDCGGSLGRFDGTPGDYAFYFTLKFDDDISTGSANYYLLNNSDLSSDGLAIRILGGAGDWGTISIVHCSASGVEEVQSAANVFLNDQESHTLKGSYSGSSEEITVWFDDTKVIDAQSLQLWDAPAADTTIGKSSESFYGWIQECVLWSDEIANASYFNVLNKNLQVVAIVGQDSAPLVDLSENSHTLTQNNGTSDFYSTTGYDSILREAFPKGGDQVGTLAQNYRAQIYDFSLDIQKNKQALIDMNLRLLIHVNDPT